MFANRSIITSQYLRMKTIHLFHENQRDLKDNFLFEVSKQLCLDLLLLLLLFGAILAKEANFSSK